MTKTAVDPWRMISLIVKAAEESGVDLERAFRFMVALTMLMAAEQKGSPSSPSRSVS